MLDSGTVAYAIADTLIESGHQIPIVTNNVGIASKLRETLHYPIFYLPGELDTRTFGLGGQATAETARLYLEGKMEVPVEIAFVAANALDPDLGLSADAAAFSEFRATALRYSRKVVLVFRGEKLLKQISSPVMPQNEWEALLRRRAGESSMWIVCHEPVGPTARERGSDTRVVSNASGTYSRRAMSWRWAELPASAASARGVRLTSRELVRSGRESCRTRACLVS